MVRKRGGGGGVVGRRGVGGSGSQQGGAVAGGQGEGFAAGRRGHVAGRCVERFPIDSRTTHVAGSVTKQRFVTKQKQCAVRNELTTGHSSVREST